MWVLKYKAKEESLFLIQLIMKYRVKVYYYALNHYEENNKFFFIVSGIVEANKSKRQKFFKDLKA